MITLSYVDNVKRLIVGKIRIQEITQNENVTQIILEIYQKAGYIKADNPEKLYIRTTTNDVRPFLQGQTLEDHCRIDYVNIVPINNAVEFARKDGIVFFFHTSEHGHQNNPHIHAKYSGDEISIYFSDLHIVGHMKSSAKQRMAITYVKENLREMLDEWGKIMDGKK